MTDTKPEVHSLFVPLKPRTRNRPAQLVLGYYTVVDDLLTMTDAEGNPATDETGKVYTAKLGPGDNARETAGQLTKTLRLALLGKDAPPEGFSRPLAYPKIGVA